MPREEVIDIENNQIGGRTKSWMKSLQLARGMRRNFREKFSDKEKFGSVWSEGEREKYTAKLAASMAACRPI